jgi:glucose/arabinose dehydrogenase
MAIKSRISSIALAASAAAVLALSPAFAQQQDGRPEGWYENLATGFWVSGEQRAEVWGRPAALAVAKDGSLLVADDTGGTIWRISYKGPPAEHAGGPAESTGAEAKKQ